MRAVRGAVLIWGLVALGLGNGCAKIVESSRVTERMTRVETVDRPPTHGHDVATVWQFEGSKLLVAVDRWRTCQRVRTNVFQRTKFTKRTVVKDSRLVWLVAAVVLGGAGAWWVAAPPEDGDITGKDAQLVGGGVAGLGAVALTVFVVDSVRAGDSFDELPERREAVGSPSPYACGEDRGEGLTPTLRLPGGRTLSATWDGSKRAVFELGDPASFPDLPPREAILDVGGRRESIPLVAWKAYADRLIAKVRGIR